MCPMSPIAVHPPSLIPIDNWHGSPLVGERHIGRVLSLYPPKTVQHDSGMFMPPMKRIDPQRAPPRHSDVDDRAEEEEHDELEQVALHNNILRHIFSSPAAFGTTGGEVTTQVVAAFDAEATLDAHISSQLERRERQPQNRSVEERVAREAGPGGMVGQDLLSPVPERFVMSEAQAGPPCKNLDLYYESPVGVVGARRS